MCGTMGGLFKLLKRQAGWRHSVHTGVYGNQRCRLK